MSKKLFIRTHGCQMNVYDSIKMQDLLAEYGYSLTEELSEAHVAILNTCHIREKASEKTYSELGRINKIKEQRKKIGASLVIVVAGCVAQADGSEMFERAPYIDIIVGPQSYHTLPDLIGKIHRKEKHLIELDFIEEEKFDKLPASSSGQGSTAFISIQEGCDKFCNFCIVPYTRGAEFSRPLEQVYREVLNEVEKGAIEVTLLGQNVNAYHGKNFEDKICNLADLIKYLSNIPTLQRIRYMTSHPVDMNEDLIALHGSEPKLMPFLHLPVQSGSNKILKAMNRKHTREEYFTIIDKLRAVRPDITLSSDIIVGYPGETDEDFNDTLDLVKRIKFGQCFSFKYSPRPGTPAAGHTQISEEIKIKRLAILQEEINKQQLEFNINCEGKIFPVLFYKDGKFKDQVVGKTPYMQSVYVNSEVKDDIFGKIIPVKILQGFATSLSAEIL